MRISVDGGGLCTESKYGTYTFSSSLISALQEYGHGNTYSIYTFCKQSGDVKFRYKKLTLKKGWMKLRVTLEEIFSINDIFLALNQSLPLYTPAKSIVFSHGFSFVRFPEFYPTNYWRLKLQLLNYLRVSRFIIASSKKVHDDIAELHPRRLDKVVVLPFGIPQDFQEYKKINRKQFFLFCGMNHPVKNVEFLVNTFNAFIKKQTNKHYQLYLVGPFTEYESKNIKVYEQLSRNELRDLYRQATAYLSASYYESFNFSVLEALSQDCPVIGLNSAIIPEMVEYCSIVIKKTDFIEEMNKAVAGDVKKINRKKLLSDFSWENYVAKLQELYKKA